MILSYGPYAKGLRFQGGYPDQWRIMTEEHLDNVAQLLLPIIPRR